MIDETIFVKSVLAAMWMLNDLPRGMRKDLDAQLGLIWLLVAEPKCFPCIKFTPHQAKAICDALEQNSNEPNFNFTYDAMLKYVNRKSEEADDADAAAQTHADTEQADADADADESTEDVVVVRKVSTDDD